jgi:hypothetical protein
MPLKMAEVKNLTFSYVFLKNKKVERQNFEKFRGIPWNYTEFRNTEFRIIPLIPYTIRNVRKCMKKSKQFRVDGIP